MSWKISWSIKFRNDRFLQDYQNITIESCSIHENEIEKVIVQMLIKFSSYEIFIHDSYIIRTYS